MYNYLTDFVFYFNTQVKRVGETVTWVMWRGSAKFRWGWEQGK